jgi:hypothetical protein
MVVGRERLALDRLSPSVARPEHQCQSVPRVQKETRTMTDPKLDGLIARVEASIPSKETQEERMLRREQLLKYGAVYAAAALKARNV